MILQLYIKPNIIGLCFASKTDRDLFWAKLADNQNCAERFGERTIRFNPAKATASFNIPLEAETIQVIVDKPQSKQEPPKPAQVAPVEAPVMPAAPAPIAPVMIIPGLDQAVLVPELKEPTISPGPQIEPPPPIAMPQVSSVTQPPLVTEANPTLLRPLAALTEILPPKPPDLRSRAGRAWKAAQQTAK